MRRVAGFTLRGLGIVLITQAVLLPAYVRGHFVKIPLDEHATAILAGTGVSYFSQVKLTEKTGVTVRVTYTIKGDAAAGTSSTAVWDETTSVRDVTNGLPVSTMTRRFAFDRRTAELVDCCRANVNGHTAIRQTGLAGTVFPIGTRKQSYQVFDTTLNRAVPFAYSGTTVTGGIQTYRFTENVAPTQISAITVPGPFFGLKPKSVKLPQMYQIHLTDWVDPQTGALLNVDEKEKMTLRNPATGGTVAVLFDGNLAATPGTVKAIVDLDSGARAKLSLIDTTIPLAAGIAGVVALTAGIFLRVRRPRQDQPHPAEPSRHLAAG